MPITSSAKKALRQSRKRNQFNLGYRSRIKTITDQIKQTQDRSLLPQAYSIIDKAAKKNVIHRNKAARIKSQISSLINTPTSTNPPKDNKKSSSKPASKTKKSPSTSTKKETKTSSTRSKPKSKTPAAEK